MKFRGDYDFLSNMYHSPIKVNGLVFTCAEAAFQSFKTLDKEERKKFQNIPGTKAKKLGKKVALRPDWNEIKIEVMHCVVKTKFKQNPELIPRLKAIPGEIVEDNTWNDTFWGRCNGIGKNTLGQILMYLRRTL